MGDQLRELTDTLQALQAEMAALRKRNETLEKRMAAQHKSASNELRSAATKNTWVVSGSKDESNSKPTHTFALTAEDIPTDDSGSGDGDDDDAKLQMHDVTTRPPPAPRTSQSQSTAANTRSSAAQVEDARELKSLKSSFAAKFKDGRKEFYHWRRKLML